MIILDFGSGNTCKNRKLYIDKMIRKLSEIDTERKCIIKWQLFLSAGKNEPLSRHSFDYAYTKGTELGFKVTASVFDIPSMLFLQEFDIPFIKIANNESLYRKIIPIVSSRVPLVVSWNKNKPIADNTNIMCCVSKYPAKFEEYKETFNPNELRKGISDHTIDWRLYRKYEPEFYEVHYKLEDSQGLDAGSFARTPNQIKEILK